MTAATLRPEEVAGVPKLGHDKLSFVGAPGFPSVCPSVPAVRPDVSLSQGSCLPHLDVPTLDNEEDEDGSDGTE